MLLQVPLEVGQQPRLRTPAAAKYCGVSSSYLNKGRLYGYGPAYSRLPGGIVVYSIGDLDEWLEARKQRSTSENAA
jgi:hypothetical protein